MNAYAFCLCVGCGGLVAMATGGVWARGHGHDGVVNGHDHTGLWASLLGRSARGFGRGARGYTRGARGGRGTPWWGVISPRVLFSVLVGFGSTGELTHERLRPVLVLLIALVGGVLFERFVVGPLWNFLLQFASKPAQTLDTAVMSEARAEMSFDADGHGLVSIELDGQVVQLLGTLRPEDRAGARVRAGDRLRVEEVDGARNRCTVSRL